MRRVAIIAPNYHPTVCGVGDHSMRLASELVGRGVDVAIFTREPAEPHPEAPSVQVFSVPAPTPLVGALRLIRILRAWRPQEAILQYTPPMLGASQHGSSAALLIATALAQTGVRVTIVAHELHLPWLRRPDLLAAAAFQRVLLLGLVAAADRFIVTTESRLEELRRLCRGLARHRRIDVVPVGSNVAPLDARRQPGRLRVGQFSSFNVSKRFDVLLDAFARIAAAVPTAELWLIGQVGSDASRRGRGLRAAIASHPAVDRIKITGRLSLPEVAASVASLSLYLFPMDTGATTRSGTLPLPLGSSVPVVATRGRETSSLFVPDENVVFADSLTGEGFARATLRLTSDPQLAKRVAEGGRRLYEQHLSWRVIAPAILS